MRQDSSPRIPDPAPGALDASAFARVLEAGGDALVVLDADWRYVYANDLALPILNRTREQLLGHNVAEVFPEIVDTPFWQAYQRAAREQALVTLEEFFEPLDKWFDVRAIPQAGLLFLHFRDVTDKKRSEERERAGLTGIFMQAPAFMAALRGPSHVFEMVNPPYYQLVGHRDIVGKPVAEALPEVVEQGFLDLLDRVYRTGEPVSGKDVPILLQTTPDGPLEERFVDFSYQPLRDGDGAVTGILAHGVDLTERKRAEQQREAALAALRDSQERLRLAFAAGQLGTWDWDIRTGRETWSPEQERLFGLDPGAYNTNPESFFALVHPEDRARVQDAVARALASDTGEYENEFRIVWPTGEVRWLYGRAQVRRDEETGAPVRMTGVNLDITARKQAEERERFLADLTARTRALLDPDEVLWETARLVGAFTGVSRCTFADVDDAPEGDPNRGTVTVHRDFVQFGAPSIVGTYPLLSFGPEIIAGLRAGNVAESADVWEDPRIGPEHRRAFADIAARSFLCAPLHREGRWAALLVLHHAAPRRWTPEERELLAAVAERAWLAVENARLFRRAQQDEARFRALVEASSQMTWRTGPDGLVTDMPQWRRYTGQTEGEVRGYGWANAVHPEDRARVERAWRAAFEARGVYESEYRVRGADGVYRWFAARGVPLFNGDGSLREYIGTWASLDEQRRAEQERAESLRREQRRAEQLRQLAEASLVINGTATLGEMFPIICDRARAIIGAHQCVVSITRGEDWSQAINAVSLSERYARWRDYGALPDGSGIYSLVCRENRTLRLTQAELEAHPAWRGFGRHAAEHSPMNGWLAVPLVARDGANLGLIQLSDRYEGEFTADDEAILVQLAQLASVAIENQRLYEEARSRAERESLINQIGDGIRQSLPPEQIEVLAVAALGKALAADRCYLFTADAAGDALVIGRDWHAEGVPSLAGRYRLSELGVEVEAVFGSGRTLVVADTQAQAGRMSSRNASLSRRLEVSAFINVPFYEGGKFVGALGVAMARGERRWTEAEVALVEAVAGQLRSVLEAARLQLRERNIAQQLQHALQPPAPPPLPGLGLASHYRPALEEAGVGGDFFDVFAVEKSCTALVVADLSGKGLAAAQQVATVRNMLRFAVYGGRTVAEAVTALHDALVEHDLLAGFATLFVGMYDHARRTLTYVNAGQEPGLIWRASTGEVEALGPTGPVVGGFIGGSFAQNTVTLRPGDVLALFTDGLTEVGPSRKDLLEVEGVIRLLRECCAGTPGDPDPQTIVDRLIAGVHAFGHGGGLRDDIALLVGVAGG